MKKLINSYLKAGFIDLTDTNAQSTINAFLAADYKVKIVKNRQIAYVIELEQIRR